MSLGRAARLAALLVAASAAIGVWAYGRLPARMSVGVGHGWIPTALALSVLPAVAALVTLGVALLAPEGSPRAALPGVPAQHPFGLIVAPAALLLVGQAALVERALDPAFDPVRWGFLALAVVLMLVGASLPRVRPNRMPGVRTPGTLADPAVRARTQRLTGRLMIAGAVALAGAAAFLPDRPLMIVLLVLTAVGAPAAGALYAGRSRREA